jgi:hypothetical protein
MRNHVGCTFAMGRDGGTAPFLRHGWSSPEPRFTWSIGTESALHLTLPAAPQGGFLELWVMPFRSRPVLTAQRLTITVDGVPSSEFHLRRPGVLAVHVPPRRSDAGPLLVTLSHPDAARPCELGPSSDARQLGFAVQTIRFLVLDRPMRGWGRRRSAAGRRIARATGNAPAIAAATVATGLPVPAMLEQFASVGDNCEFGLLQRQCRAEPLGLLRFCGAQIPDVVRGIDAGFEGLGDPDDIVPELAKGDWAEWIVHEKRYDLHYHTDIRGEAATAEQVLADETIKLHFMRRLFMEDLAEGRKLYVCKRTDPKLTREEVMPLFLALNRHGANRLLWVVPADEVHPAGTVVRELPGLLRGHIDRFAPPGRVPDLSVPGWLAVCAGAWALTQVKRAQAA